MDDSPMTTIQTSLAEVDCDKGTFFFWKHVRDDDDDDDDDVYVCRQHPLVYLVWLEDVAQTDSSSVVPTQSQTRFTNDVNASLYIYIYMSF